MLLLLVNIFIQSKVAQNGEKTRTENYVFEIDSIFQSALVDYALEANWIKRVSIDNNNFDSLNYVCNISIPSDLSVTELLQDINKAFQNTESYFVSEELKNFGKSTVKIYSGGILKFQGYVTIDKKIFRNRNKVALIVDITNVNIISELNRILELPFPFTLLFNPSKENMSLINPITNHQKEFGILISDYALDENYQLSGKFNKNKLITNIGNIVESFKDASIFIIDDKSSLYSSAVFSFIKNEFSRNGINLFKKSNFKLLEIDNQSEIISLFDFFTSGEDISVTNNIYLTKDNFELLQPRIENSEKKGTKFVMVN